MVLFIEHERVDAFAEDCRRVIQSHCGCKVWRFLSVMRLLLHQVPVFRKNGFVGVES